MAGGHAPSPPGPDLRATEDTPAHPGRSARAYHRTIELVPLRQPGHRRRDAWYSQWWQASTQDHLEEVASLSLALTADRAARAAAAAASLERRLADETEVGWAAIRPGAYRTHDTLVTYSLARMAP